MLSDGNLLCYQREPLCISPPSAALCFELPSIIPHLCPSCQIFSMDSCEICDVFSFWYPLLSFELRQPILTAHPHSPNCQIPTARGHPPSSPAIRLSETGQGSLLGLICLQVIIFAMKHFFFYVIQCATLTCKLFSGILNITGRVSLYFLHQISIRYRRTCMERRGETVYG